MTQMDEKKMNAILEVLSSGDETDRAVARMAGTLTVLCVSLQILTVHLLKYPDVAYAKLLSDVMDDMIVRLGEISDQIMTSFDKEDEG